MTTSPYTSILARHPRDPFPAISVGLITDDTHQVSVGTLGGQRHGGLADRQGVTLTGLKQDWRISHREHVKLLHSQLAIREARGWDQQGRQLEEDCERVGRFIASSTLNKLRAFCRHFRVRGMKQPGNTNGAVQLPAASLTIPIGRGG